MHNVLRALVYTKIREGVLWRVLCMCATSDSSAHHAFVKFELSIAVLSHQQKGMHCWVAAPNLAADQCIPFC